MTVKRSVRGSMLVSLAVVSAMVVAGCGGGDGPNTTPTHKRAVHKHHRAAECLCARSQRWRSGFAGHHDVSRGSRRGGSLDHRAGHRGEHSQRRCSRLIRIRSAPHPDEGYDRIVFDIDGELPGYTISYVDEVWQDGSGDLVEVPGRRYLLVTFFPAVSHSDDGQAVVLTAQPRAGLSDDARLRARQRLRGLRGGGGRAR